VIGERLRCFRVFIAPVLSPAAQGSGHHKTGEK
jgi:hypothetical protein